MKKTNILAIGLLVGAFGTSVLADETRGMVDFLSIKKTVKNSNANWSTKDSWVTRLPKEDIRRMLGLKHLPKGRLDFESVPSTKASETVDWRNYQGVNWLGPVMNQGNCGSCVAFASIATLEAQTSISLGGPWFHGTFSPQALFSCGGGGCETGWEPDGAASYLQDNGVPDEACMPYSSGSTGDDTACNVACSDSDSRSTKISGYSSPTFGGGSVNSVKAALKKGPLVTTLSVYADFVTYGSGVYKHVAGSVLGGHAVSLVGYSDAKRAWLIRNSWGPEWGEGGFAWISWDDSSGVGSETWGYQISVPQQFISVTSPSDKEYVSGQYSLSATNKGLQSSGSNEISFHIQDANGRDLTTLACMTTGGSCSTALDTTKLKEGRYEIFATGGASVKSQVREFYVINSEPKTKISFTAASGTNLNSPLSGRPEFEVDVDSSPIPLQHIEFRAVDSQGKVAAVKNNDYVLSHMKMGWRTITVPNGKYSLLFHGQTIYNGKTYEFDSSAVSVTVKN